jgi:hypothetical protein
MKTRSVELLTYYTAMYHDLIAEGLKVTLVSGHLDPRIRDKGNSAAAARPAGSTTGKSATITPRRRNTARCLPRCSARSG